jgi:hypothetical protein
MKRFLRYLVFSLICFYFIQMIYFPFSLSSDKLSILYLLSVIVLTTFFSRTFLRIIRFPHTGIGFLFLNIVIHSLSLFLTSFYLRKFDYFALNFRKYDLFGIIITPEIFLEKYTSLLMFSALYCLLFGFLYFISWTHENKR